MYGLHRREVIRLQQSAQLVTIDYQDGIPIVRVVGEIDLCTRKQFDEAIQSVYAICTARAVILDATALSFIDGEGVNGLVRFYNQLAKQGKRLMLANPQPHVRRFLGIARVVSLFDPIYESLEEALTAARAP